MADIEASSRSGSKKDDVRQVVESGGRKARKQVGVQRRISRLTVKSILVGGLQKITYSGLR
jgi:hypothetical protein